MNARKIWTELFQKPAGRLVLFLLVGGIFLAFILVRRTPQPKPDNTPVASQATRAKGYSFDEDIPPPMRAQTTTPSRESDRVALVTPTPKPPPPIPQTIFATREQSFSELFLPYGRLLRAEDEISDPGEIVLFPRSEADCQAFLVSQMRLNDELAKALDMLERRGLLNLLWPVFPSRAYLALINNTP